MMQCCKNKTAPFCDECGADLEAKSLAGLRKHLFTRLESANKRLTAWTDAANNADNDQEKVSQGIARSTDTVVQLESWIVELDKATG